MGLYVDSTLLFLADRLPRTEYLPDSFQRLDVSVCLIGRENCPDVRYAPLFTGVLREEQFN